ncbi:MAG TPA: ComF family protein [Coleofasciculaceae cyanobacterium]|jgi:ComF family protein
MLKQLLCVFLESRCLFCDRAAEAEPHRIAYPEGNRATANTLCQYCSKKLASHQLTKSDRFNLQRDLSIFAWGKYDGQLKRAIALMKYDRQPEIGTVLGRLLGQAWLDSSLTKSLQKVTVVPIPLHHKKLKERGFNQAEVIAKGFCQVTRYTLNSQALIRVKETKAMFDITNLEERAKNLQGAFHIGNKLPKNPVLLVDDIYTTGTTVKESIKVLQKQTQVFGVAVAAKAGIDKQSRAIASIR